MILAYYNCFLFRSCDLLQDTLLLFDNGWLLKVCNKLKRQKEQTNYFLFNLMFLNFLQYLS
jgi:hypothetical protein